MARYAVVDGSGAVVNLVEWDGVAQWEPPAGHTVIADTLGYVDTDWTYNGAQFIPPPGVLVGDPQDDMSREATPTPKSPVAKNKKK